MPDALQLLQTRRSVKPMELTGPGPSRPEIDTLLAIASRVPDHGKLAPWRFIVFEGGARIAAGAAIAAAFAADRADATPEQIEFERKRLARAPLVIAVVSRAGPHVKIPEWEQQLSAGASAMSLVFAAHAMGYAASWITEWYAYDRRVLDHSASAQASASQASSISAAPPSHPRIASARRSRPSSPTTPAEDSMFYEPDKRDPRLRHDPFKAIVAPRPIGWITSMNLKGQVNLAPYSYFNGINSRPNLVMFASEGFKDSVSFIEETGEFVCNLATWDLREAMNATSAPLPRGVNEMERAGLEPAPSRLVKPPRVKASPCALECKRIKIVTIDNVDGKPVDCHVVFGQVVGVHIDDRFIVDGRLDTAAMKPIARCGYDQYAVVESLFSIQRPAN